jgi:hypothetical protein
MGIISCAPLLVLTYKRALVDYGLFLFLRADLLGGWVQGKRGERPIIDLLDRKVGSRFQRGRSIDLGMAYKIRGIR